MINMIWYVNVGKCTFSAVRPMGITSAREGMLLLLHGECVNISMGKRDVPVIKAKKKI